MEFRPSPIEGSSAVEIWDGPRRAATLYAQTSGLHLICEEGYAPDALELELQQSGLQIGIRREL